MKFGPIPAWRNNCGSRGLRQASRRASFCERVFRKIETKMDHGPNAGGASRRFDDGPHNSFAAGPTHVKTFYHDQQVLGLDWTAEFRIKTVRINRVLLSAKGGLSYVWPGLACQAKRENAQDMAVKARPMLDKRGHPPEGPGRLRRSRGNPNSSFAGGSNNSITAACKLGPSA